MNINIAWDPATDITNATADGAEPGLRAGTHAAAQRLHAADGSRSRSSQRRSGPGKRRTAATPIPFFTALPVATTNLMVQMDGHPKALPPGEVDWAKSVNAAAGMTVFYTGTPRAKLVSQAKCENCHNQLQLHGTNRSGDPQGCTVCHNSSGGYADDGSSGTIAFGAFVAQHPHRRSAGDRRGHVSAEHRQLPGVPHRRHVLHGAAGCGRDQHGIGCGPVQPDGRHLELGDRRHLRHLPQRRRGAGPHGVRTAGSSTSSAARRRSRRPTTEACSVCHGPGRVADTVQVHAE